MKSSLLVQGAVLLSHAHAAISEQDAVSPDTEAQHAVKDRAAIAAHLGQENPMAIRKMSTDPSAMFFPEYWGFEDDVTKTAQSQMVNLSVSNDMLQPAILPVFLASSSDDSSPESSRALVLPRIFSTTHNNHKRAFTCPSGTSQCSNIGRSDACCPSGLTCANVANTGLGDVGCCASGGSCGGQLAGCQEGYTECTSFGGGCCIPGYQCVPGGCVLIGTQTVVVRPTSTSTTSTTSSGTTSSSSPSPPPTPATTTVVTTSTVSTTTTTTTTSQSSTSSTTQPPPTTSSASILPPARPTSAAPSSPGTTTSAAEICPTGYYQCSAYYNSGACCQVGRDCGLTSCPAKTTQTVLATNGVTVLAPAGAVTAAPNVNRGGCAAGWYSCAASVGGNCCPTGFNCGTASCWLNATAGAPGINGNTPKDSPSAATKATTGKLWWLVTLAAGIAIAGS